MRSMLTFNQVLLGAVEREAFWRHVVDKKIW